jgi:hypothetical protein
MPVIIGAENEVPLSLRYSELLTVLKTEIDVENIFSPGTENITQLP